MLYIIIYTVIWLIKPIFLADLQIIIVTMKKFLRYTAITFCGLTLIISIVGLCVITAWQQSDDFVPFDKSKLTSVCATLTVLDDNGVPVCEPTYLNNNRQIPLRALPEHVYMAFVCVEDKRFFYHNGVDLKRIIAATLKNVSKGYIKEGASTISQQLIKNTHLNNCKTFSRKLNEIILANRLEHTYSKQEILEMYLNTIYFGRHAYGIENAANVYFSKSASELSLAESAALAGMIKAPNNYAPDKNPQKCLLRRNIVLKLMLNQGVIDRSTYNAALSSELFCLPNNYSGDKTYMNGVIDEACSILNMTESQLFQSGFLIETYCDAKIQQTLTSLAQLDNTTADNSRADFACVVANNHKEIVAAYCRGEADSKKQVGSTIKPIAVYAPAFNEGLITQASPILDEETDFNGYRPCNYGRYYGWTTVKTALTKSLNVPAVKILNALTLKKAEWYLQKMGFNDKQDLSLALGNVQGGMTPKMLCECYSALACNGQFGKLNYVKKIYNQRGELLYDRKTNTTKVFDQTATYLVTDLLCEATKSGTAARLKSLPFQVACKTGTVGDKNGNSAAIAAGYTTEHTFVIEYSGSLSNEIKGSTAPCEFARKFLGTIYENNAPVDFAVPPNVGYFAVDVERLNLKQQIVLCQRGETYAFDKRNLPKAYSI